MTKLILPTVLIALVLAIGTIAFIPVEQASSTHLIIQGTQLSEAGTLDADQSEADLNADNITITSTTDFVVGCIISNNSGGLEEWTATDGTASTGTVDIDDAASMSYQRTVNAGDTLTVSATPGGAGVEGYCTAMTTSAGAIVYG